MLPRCRPLSLRTLVFIMPLLVVVTTARAQIPAWPAVIRPQGAQGIRPVISALAVSPDGKKLVTAGDDHLLRVWSLVSGEHVSTLAGHQDWVKTVCFSADGATVYSGGNDHQIIAWDLASGDSRMLPSVGFAVARIDVSPSGHQLAVAGFGDTIVLFDLPAGTIQKRYPTRCDDIRSVRFSHDSRWLAAGGRDGRIMLWDLETDELVADPHWHSRRVRDLQFDRHDRVLYSVAEDRKLHAWNLVNAEQGFTLDLGPGKTMALALCGEHHIATSGSDNRVQIWQIEGRRRERVLEGHTGSVVALVAHGSRLVSAGYDTTVRSWDLQLAPPKPLLSAKRVGARSSDSPAGGRR